MKKIIIALIVLIVVGLGAYYLVFRGVYKSVENVNIVSSIGSSVEMKDFSFSPQMLRVKVGTKVTWTNNDSVPHTITSDSDGVLGSSTISPRNSFAFTFTKVGITNYHCSIHPMMKGVVIVEN